MRGITILGATGSIGLSTLDVLARHPQRYRVVALTANSQVERLACLCEQFQPQFAVMADDDAATQLAVRIKSTCAGTSVLSGIEGLLHVAAHESVDDVMAAIVGAAGLAPTLAAAQAGKRVLLANKEALVMSGQLFMDAIRDHNAELLPIDSEHNAIFQCLPEDYHQGLAAVGVKRILLTGSGGPFRSTAMDLLTEVTPAQACAHPNWDMGRKISVDSATMMNKGLEFIEACWLFNASPDEIEIVVHPQSIIHSMVEYVDGSILAQLGQPDMRTPIAHALAWPERIDSGVQSLDLFAVGRLDFERPDFNRFPCLRLADEAMRQGGTAAATLNAANEVAVEHFLNNEIRFTDIPRVIENVIARASHNNISDLEQVMNADASAREQAMIEVAACRQNKQRRLSR
ncbi:MAG: 1-deoxy-D-xylulose-5-phosphate reductoisomerase [Gammaproteobacteria bacterium]